MATRTLFRLTVATEAGSVDYAPGIEADETPIDAARLAAITTAAGGKRPRNVRKASADETAAGVAAVIVNRKARARRISLALSSGEKIVTNGSGSTATDLSRVSVDAKRAAVLAALDDEETAAFMLRFPTDGSVPPQPSSKVAAATERAFRKVNALAGSSHEWSVAGAAVETLS